jgi:hypothetical protein
MTRARLTVRLDTQRLRALRSHAEARGLSHYAMLAQVVETGFARLDSIEDPQAALSELAHELVRQGQRQVEADRILDRTLFTACAAYAYARNLALGTRRPDNVIADEARDAFERQRAIAREVTP